MAPHLSIHLRTAHARSRHAMRLLILVVLLCGLFVDARARSVESIRSRISYCLTMARSWYDNAAGLERDLQRGQVVSSQRAQVAAWIVEYRQKAAEYEREAQQLQGELALAVQQESQREQQRQREAQRLQQERIQAQNQAAERERARAGQQEFEAWQRQQQQTRANEQARRASKADQQAQAISALGGLLTNILTPPPMEDYEPDPAAEAAFERKRQQEAEALQRQRQQEAAAREKRRAEEQVAAQNVAALAMAQAERERALEAGRQDASALSEAAARLWENRGDAAAQTLGRLFEGYTDPTPVADGNVSEGARRGFLRELTSRRDAVVEEAWDRSIDSLPPERQMEVRGWRIPAAWATLNFSEIRAAYLDFVEHHFAEPMRNFSGEAQEP